MPFMLRLFPIKIWRTFGLTVPQYSESLHKKNWAGEGWSGCNGICWVFLLTETRHIRHPLQPWLVEFVCWDLNIFWGHTTAHCAQGSFSLVDCKLYFFSWGECVNSLNFKIVTFFSVLFLNSFVNYWIY